MRLPILLFLFFEAAYSQQSPQDCQPSVSLPPGVLEQIIKQFTGSNNAVGTVTDEPSTNEQPPPNHQHPQHPYVPYQRISPDQEDVQRVQNMHMNPHIHKRMAGGYEPPQQFYQPPPFPTGQEVGQQNIPNWQGPNVRQQGEDVASQTQQVMDRGQILQKQGQQMVQQGREMMQQRRQEMLQYQQQMQRKQFEARKQLELQQQRLQQQQQEGEQPSIQSPQYVRPDGDAPSYDQIRRFPVQQVQQIPQNFQNEGESEGYQQPRYLQPDGPHYQYGPACQRPVPPGPPSANEEPPRPVYFGRPPPGAPTGQGEAAPEQRRFFRRVDPSRIQVVRQESQQQQ